MRGKVIRGALLTVVTFFVLRRFYQSAEGLEFFLNLATLIFVFLIFALLSLDKLRVLRLGVYFLSYSKVFSLFSSPQLKIVESIFELAGATLSLWNIFFFFREDLNKQLLELAFRDSLTGVMNRHSFSYTVGKVLKKLERTGRGALIYMDIDKFKAVNDKYGHLVGDKVLEIIGKRIKNSLKESDFVARYGGDEFVAFLQDIDRDQARQIVQRVSQAVSAPIFVNNHVFNIGITCGMAFFPQDGETLLELIKKADKRMYSIKFQECPENLDS